MSLPEACCTLPPVKAEYTPKGSYIEVNGMKVYSVGATDAKVAVIGVYDVFGFHNNTLQFADLVSQAAHARVLIPDFFRGSPWTEEMMKTRDRSELFKWIQQEGSWEKLQPDLNAVTEVAKKDGAHKVFLFGFCWGAKIAQHGVMQDATTYSGAAFIHPSVFTNEEAKHVKAPIILVPSKDEADMLPYMGALKEANPAVYAKSEHHRFDDVHHGYCAARGDWTNEVQAKRANETVKLVSEFYKRLS